MFPLICTVIKLPPEGKFSTVAEAVIAILSSEWPLSLKCIHYRVTKKYSMPVSFQAAYKAVNKLREEGILIKDESLYLLSPQWLDSLHKFSSETKRIYEAGASESQQNFLPPEPAIPKDNLLAQRCS